MIIWSRWTEASLQEKKELVLYLVELLEAEEE